MHILFNVRVSKVMSDLHSPTSLVAQPFTTLPPKRISAASISPHTQKVDAHLRSHCPQVVSFSLTQAMVGRRNHGESKNCNEFTQK